MVMTGSAIGPVLGGVLVQNAGYEWLGYAIAGCAVIAVLSFRRVGATPQVLDSANAAVAH
jgi:MFS family permease